jgi:nicotinamidase-related amidase
VTESSPLIYPAVLLLVDPQQGGSFPPDQQPIRCIGADEAIPVMIRVRDAARRAGIPIIVTQELHRTDRVDFGRELDGQEAVHCLEGTDEARLVPELAPSGPREYLVPKRRYSGFFGTDLDLLLRGLGTQTVVMAGGLTDVCLHYTAVDAHQHDYRIRVISDATPASSEQAREASLRAIEYLQTGAVVPSETILAAFDAFASAERTGRSELTPR